MTHDEAGKEIVDARAICTCGHELAMHDEQGACMHCEESSERDSEANFPLWEKHCDCEGFRVRDEY